MPPRYLVPVLPLLAAPLVRALEEWRGLGPRAIVVALGVVGLALGLAALGTPGMDVVRMAGVGENPLLARIGARLPGQPDPNDLLPSFVRGPMAVVPAQLTAGETGAVGQDAQARTGRAKATDPGRDRAGYITSGRPISRHKGRIRMSAFARGDGPGGADPVIRLEGWRQAPDRSVLVASRDVSASELPAERFAEVSVAFDSPVPFVSLELRVYWYGTRPVALDDLIIWAD